MRRACISAGVVMALVATFGNQALAGERRSTRTVHYTGWAEWHFFMGGASGPGDNAVFAAPSWARSVGVSVNDDTELNVAYKVRFEKPSGANTGPAHGCGGRPQRFALPRGTKRVFVQTEAPAWGPAPGCDQGVIRGVPTTGTVTVTFSSRVGGRILDDDGCC